MNSSRRIYLTVMELELISRWKRCVCDAIKIIQSIACGDESAWQQDSTHPLLMINCILRRAQFSPAIPSCFIPSNNSNNSNNSNSSNNSSNSSSSSSSKNWHKLTESTLESNWSWNWFQDDFLAKCGRFWIQPAVMPQICKWVLRNAPWNARPFPATKSPGMTKPRRWRNMVSTHLTRIPIKLKASEMDRLKHGHFQYSNRTININMQMSGSIDVPGPFNLIVTVPSSASPRSHSRLLLVSFRHQQVGRCEWIHVAGKPPVTDSALAPPILSRRPTH